MYQICIGFCVILSLFDGCFSHTFYREGQEVIIDCDPKQHSVITFWFKINRSGAKHLLTFKGTDVKENVDKEKYSLNKNAPSGKVSLYRFHKNEKKNSKNIGHYSCIHNRFAYIFVADPATPPPKLDPAPPKTTTPVITTKAQCKCAKQDPKPSINCETWILSSLASGCGVLLILLIFTILYCNRLRTRRCPHHYKRQPRPAGHAKLPNSHF
uniref:CD8 alpha n=1 Tax=Sinocyclocheilus rhinocerous TaxID=307959 RepID=A0A673IAW8_9TELE